MAIVLNESQANDFIIKYMQNNIYVVDISKDDEDEVYFVILLSGKLFRRKMTKWQYRFSLSHTDVLLGACNIGLCFGSYVKPFTNRRYDFYEFDPSLLEKANEVTKNSILKWENKSPV